LTGVALERLLYLVDHAKDQRVQLDAASEILNRGWGRPHQAIAVAAHVTAQGGIDAPPAPQTLEDAEAWLARRRKELDAMLGPPKPLGPPVVDVVPEPEEQPPPEPPPTPAPAPSATPIWSAQKEAEWQRQQQQQERVHMSRPHPERGPQRW
jgi:hypothetical protein